MKMYTHACCDAQVHNRAAWVHYRPCFKKCLMVQRLCSFCTTGHQVFKLVYGIDRMPVNKGGGAGKADNLNTPMHAAVQPKVASCVA